MASAFCYQSLQSVDRHVGLNNRPWVVIRYCFLSHVSEFCDILASQKYFRIELSEYFLYVLYFGLQALVVFILFNSCTPLHQAVDGIGR